MRNRKVSKEYVALDSQRLGVITRDILQYVAIGALCIVALSSPVGASKITEILWKESKKALSGYLGKRFKRLWEAGVITTQGGKVVLTKRGRHLLARAELDKLKIRRHRWDHIWRCVAYDIPNSLTNSRQGFNRRLIKLGFVQVQKSVLVCPYKSREEVAIVARLYEIEKYILFMETKDLPAATRLKDKFGLAK